MRKNAQHKNKPIKADLTNAPRIQVRFLWHNDWWDGPLAGMCEYKGQKCWYHCHHENYKENRKYWRRYGVFKLTPEELAEEEKWHQLFCDKVGDHFDCDDRGHRKRSELRPYHLHNEFYDEFKHYERPKYEQRHDRVIGFFDLVTRTTA